MLRGFSEYNSFIPFGSNIIRVPIDPIVPIDWRRLIREVDGCMPLLVRHGVDHDQRPPLPQHRHPPPNRACRIPLATSQDAN